MDEKKIQKNNEENEKAKAKDYENYIKQFTPKPKYFSNSAKAFIVGGVVCTVAYYVQQLIIKCGVSETDAATFTTLILIVSAQFLTGIGVFDTITKFAGAGVIVPITGFANSMVAPAMDFKKEGIVLGVGSKLFSIAGPVIVCGISVSVIIGIIYWLIG